MTNNLLPPIDPKKEIKKITNFIQQTLKKTGEQKVVIGISGGIDSTTALFLLCQTLNPKNIYVAHLSYFDSISNTDQILHQLKIPHKNIHHLSIKKAVNEAARSLNVILGSEATPESKQHDPGQARMTKIRLGNIMARMRMIFLYDLAKKHDALVCGTENKSEHLLGYFTRYGDEASDFEPIRHLYKTQIYQLAKYLDVPAEIIKQTPTAGLWHDQTDEKEFDFSYEEADQVLYLYFDKKQTLEKIKTHGFKNAEKIISWAKNNHFKHEVPYTI